LTIISNFQSTNNYEENSNTDDGGDDVPCRLRKQKSRTKTG
jgi:hypothetical protein